MLHFIKILLMWLQHANNFVGMNIKTFHGNNQSTYDHHLQFIVSDAVPNFGNVND